MKWSFEEDYIICIFCEKYKYRVIDDKRLDELVAQLEKAGVNVRSKAAVKQRARNCQYSLVGEDAPNISFLQKERCENFIRRNLDQECYRGLQLYLDENYICNDTADLEKITTAAQQTIALLPIGSVGPSFKEILFNHIDQKQMKDSEVYKRAQIGRDTFSNIRCGKKVASKKTVMQLCFGLKLTYDEAVTLMAAANHAFNNHEIVDLVVVYFLKNKIYDTYAVNAELYERNEELLFSGKFAYCR